MTSEREKILAERRALRREYGELYDRVSQLLFNWDSIGINFEYNTDEYEPEVGTILPRLRSCACAEDVQQVVYKELCRWFDVEDAGLYDNPQYSKCDDAKLMIKIAGIIEDEFGWEDNGKE